ncbi:MAG: hypothetical protein AB1791_13765 [Chloroflexota bacterium]
MQAPDQELVEAAVAAVKHSKKYSQTADETVRALAVETRLRSLAFPFHFFILGQDRKIVYQQHGRAAVEHDRRL